MSSSTWEERFDKTYNQERFNEIGFVFEDFEHVKLFIKSEIATAVQEERKRIIENYKPTLDKAHATAWLRDRYGLEDTDILNAAEVEELLQDFISEHSAIIYGGKNE